MSKPKSILMLCSLLFLLLSVGMFFLHSSWFWIFLLLCLILGLCSMGIYAVMHFLIWVAVFAVVKHMAGNGFIAFGVATVVGQAYRMFTKPFRAYHRPA